MHVESAICIRRHYNFPVAVLIPVVNAAFFPSPLLRSKVNLGSCEVKFETFATVLSLNYR